MCREGGAIDGEYSRCKAQVGLGKGLGLRILNSIWLEQRMSEEE